MSGEDGVLKHILWHLPERDNWCVEFGAWNGVFLSNTYYLISNYGYDAVLIEGDKARFKELKHEMSRWPKTVCVNRYVRIDAPDSLDCILGKTPIGKTFDLLSIDIDGDDYHIWDSLHNYSPKVVIIEIGMQFKPDIHKINEIGSQYVYRVSGSSVSSMTELALRKGYKLICCVGCNAVYVKSEFYSIYHTRDIKPTEVFCYDELSFNRLTWPEKLRKLKLISMRPKSALIKSITRKMFPRKQVLRNKSNV